MAVTTVASRDIRFRISYDDGETFKKVVCKQAFGVELTKDAQTEQSDCGQHLAVGNSTDSSFNVEFILNTTPAVGETSADEMFTAAQNGTKVVLKADDADADPTYYRSASGYITNYSESGPLNGLLKGTGTFKVDGVIDTTA